jgi:hypothetical protein
VDVDVIEPGLDFVCVLDEQVSSCDVLLAIIGPTWSRHGMRKVFAGWTTQDDFVRIELALALKQDIRAIRVLFDGVRLSREEDLPEHTGSISGQSGRMEWQLGK